MALRIAKDELEQQKKLLRSGDELSCVLSFAQMDLSTHQGWEKLPNDPDLLILDSGAVKLDRRRRKYLAETLRPKWVIHIGHPVRQFADMRRLILDEKYAVRFMRGYDFFPHTMNLESMMVLERKHDGPTTSTSEK